MPFVSSWSSEVKRGRAGWDAKHLPNVYFSLREASKHLPSRPKHLQPAPTVTRARPGGGPLPHSPGAPRPGQPLATYLGPKAARYAGISPVLARLNPLFRSKTRTKHLEFSSKHLRQTLRFGPKHLPNTPQKVLRSTLQIRRGGFPLACGFKTFWEIAIVNSGCGGARLEG